MMSPLPPCFTVSFGSAAFFFQNLVFVLGAVCLACVRCVLRFDVTMETFGGNNVKNFDVAIDS